MTRLALARTIVSGTITLQGNTFTFTASSSGTATGNTVTEAKTSATVASNSAAVTAARASIDKILAENSAVLSDLEITSLISNNLSTTVKVFKPILLKSIATTTDGVNYTLVKETVIKSDQWLTVPNGISLTIANYHFTNNGYFQVGEPLQDTTTAQADYFLDFSNNGFCEIFSQCTINSGVTFQNSAEFASLVNHGICTNNGTILNSADYTYINNFGEFHNSPLNFVSATIKNNGLLSNLVNAGGTFFNDAGCSITNNGENSGVYNRVYAVQTGIFNNDGAINNTGTGSLTQNVGIWTGTGTCGPAGTCQL